MTTKGFSKFFNLIQFSGDIFFIHLSYVIAYFLSDFHWTISNINDHYLFLYLTSIGLWVTIVVNQKIYSLTTLRKGKIDTVIWFSIKSVVIYFLLIFSFIGLFKESYISREFVVIYLILFSFFTFTFKLSFTKFLNAYRSKGSNFRYVAILGTNTQALELMKYFTGKFTHGYQFIGFITQNQQTIQSNFKHHELIIGSLSDLYAKKIKIDELYTTDNMTNQKILLELVKFCDNNLVRLHFAPFISSLFRRSQLDVEFINSIPTFKFRQEPLENLYNRAIKRIFDLVFSIIIIVFVFPWLMPIIACIIKFTSNGPVFFIQKRSGRNNKTFPCIKFRSMQLNKDSDKKQATANDYRLTKIGAFMRKTNIDELPQFFNVFIGQMSVVGPRPHMLEHTKYYSKIVDRFMVRHLVKPGITGWAQVSGFRGPTIVPRDMIKRVQYDLWYIEHWSFILDLRIIFLTVYNVFKGEKNAL
jgi:Undecaprenyl-phosphate glucose phosphotransferase